MGYVIWNLAHEYMANIMLWDRTIEETDNAVRFMQSGINFILAALKLL